MYLARDKNNDLYLFGRKPVRGKECWWAEGGIDGSYLKMENSLYPQVTWDSEPLLVALVIPAGEGSEGRV
ncbi:MAG: hypothetical protein JXB25_00115 [Deltaproteobacteria bacterium]|nr:hypothetical protein [Deltaproteobacteria bacterium]